MARTRLTRRETTSKRRPRRSSSKRRHPVLREPVIQLLARDDSDALVTTTSRTALPADALLPAGAGLDGVSKQTAQANALAGLTGLETGGGGQAAMAPFLTIRVDPADQGDRPLAPTRAYASNRVMIGSDDIPAVTVRNLGNQPLFAVMAEFFWFMPGDRIAATTRREIGTSATLAACYPGADVTIHCANPAPNLPLGAVVMACVYDLAGDMAGPSLEPAEDRHYGQTTYPFAGHWSGSQTIANASANRQGSIGTSFRYRHIITPLQAGNWHLQCLGQQGGAETGGLALVAQGVPSTNGHDLVLADQVHPETGNSRSYGLRLLRNNLLASSMVLTWPNGEWIVMAGLMQRD